MTDPSAASSYLLTAQARAKGHGSYSVIWSPPFVTLTTRGMSPREALRNAYRLRRARFLCDMPTGWMSDREHFRWLRLARRIGVMA